MNSNHRAFVRGRRQVSAMSRRVARSGGASRDRTDDLLVANQTLSQLSYGPFPINRLNTSVLVVVAPLGVTCRWWVWEELHLRPHPYQGCALTN